MEAEDWFSRLPRGGTARKWVFIVAGAGAVLSVLAGAIGFFGSGIFARSLLGFWGLAPPLWFLYEYWAYDRRGEPQERDRVKAFQECARPLWAALLAVLLMLAQPLLTSCTGVRPTFVTLLGDPLPASNLPEAAQAEQEAYLAEARRRLAAEPGSEEALVWVGRRLAYLGRYREALDVYTRGLAVHPDSVRLLRHRGHRWITVRKLDHAVADLQRAADLLGDAPLHVEQDGLPNAAGIPLSTTEGNVHYHLGLAHYLSGDFDAALAAYDRRLVETDRNDDNRCATAYWRFLCLARTGRPDAAQQAVAGIGLDTEVIENEAYRDLCLLFRGELTEQQVLERHGILSDGDPAGGVPGATLAYGLAMAAALEAGDRPLLERRCRAIVDRSEAVSAFGYIAAEAELAAGARRLL